MKYFYILGRNPALSAAEVLALHPDGKIVACANDILILESPDAGNNVMFRLGGTIKAGFLQDGIYGKEDLEAVCEGLFYGNDVKIKKNFGISYYTLENKDNELFTQDEVNQLGMGLKRKLASDGGRIRFVTSREPKLSAVIVEKNHLLDQGCEFVIIGNNEGFYVGVTSWVQEFESASHRDFGRPARSMKVGMVPLQLAKIMLNLGRVSEGKIVLDPFCGFGTILSESLFMGAHVIGSDIERKMILGTERNLKWTQKEFGIQNVEYNFFQSPVEEIALHIDPQSIDAIVTEPFLGSVTNTASRMENIQELAKLYVASFEQFAKVLKPGGRVVFLFPAYKQQGQQTVKVSDSVLPAIKKFGFLPIVLIPEELATHYDLKTTHSLLYSRPDQHVLREVMVFEKTFDLK